MENNQPIIIKRVKRIAAGHHGGAWKIAFADFAPPDSKPRMHRTRKPEDFEVDLEKRTARHRVCGTTFLFYNYETLDGLRPHLLAGDSPEWPWQELAEPATKAFRLAEKRRPGR